MLSLRSVADGWNAVNSHAGGGDHVVGGTSIQLGLGRGHIDRVAIVDESPFLKIALGVKLLNPWLLSAGFRPQFVPRPQLLFPPPLSQRYE